MKKIITLIALTGFLTMASAHHMAQSDVAGDNIVEWSPHLDMVF